MEEAQTILKRIGYDTESDQLKGHVASAVRAVDVLIGGFGLLATNAVGVMARDIALVEGLVTGVTPVVPTPSEFLQMMASDASAWDKTLYVGEAIVKYNPLTLAAESLYRVGRAAYDKNAEELRNASYELLTFGLTMRSGKESPASKKQLQLKLKEVAFRKQQITRGVIEKSPLSDLLYEANNTKQYVIKSASRDVNGAVVEGKVYAADTFAKACDGLMEINAKGEVVYKVCFAPGTLVHTDQGLLAIENIRIGTRVLAQPEQGGERAYRTVINTVAHLDQEVYAVQIQEDGAETLSTLIATANHPFWVENILVENDHWLAIECLEPGHTLQLADGRSASVHAVGKIRRTQHAHLGFAADDRAGVGMVLDISGKQIKLASDEHAFNLGQLDLGEPYLTPVHNFEVEDFHTYYVGDGGVWVHNTNCSATTTDGVSAREIALNKAEAKARLDIETCFAAGTLVHTKEGLRPIEELRVGDLVLTWPEDKPIPVRPCHPFRLEDEYIYKPVTKTYVHEDQMISHVVIRGYGKTKNDDEILRITPNHPVWSKRHGWVQASTLKFGHSLLQANFADNLIRGATHDVERVTVYNIEVEDCHTYFVGEKGIWVHNKGENVVEIAAIRDVQTEILIYGERSHKTDLEIDAGVKFEAQHGE